MEEKIIEFKKIIEKSNKILLINHIRMDMDAFWSLSAFYDILSKLWKDIKAINDEKPLDAYNFIWYNHIIEPDLDIYKFNPDTIISFDAASLWQLWKTYEKFEEVFHSKDFVVIDHHKTNSGFWKLNIINSNYSSTCELIYDIIKELDYNKYIDKKIATSLLSWIYTDTNIYYNSNTTSNTLKVSSELMDLWADFRKPYYELYKKKSFDSSKLWWEVLANYMKISGDSLISWAMVPKDIFKKTNTNYRQLTWLISEFFANIEGVWICFLSYELDNWDIKTSFRSSEKYDISKIAEYFWWWWHKQAAWFTSNKNLKVLEQEILEQIKKQLF